jgi:glycosyltransferase involved in cell wall biosynthesis
LILVGRQEKGKGTGILIESLPLILEDFPGATLEIVGDGSARGELEALATQTGVRDRVKFRGNVAPATVLKCLQEADLFCFPTESEGFPKVVVEALACGLPVVTTRVSVLPVLLSRGAGVLLDELTPASVATGVRSCLSQPETYRAMSASALETAKDYSLENWRDRIGERLSAAWGPLRAPVEPLRREARS